VYKDEGARNTGVATTVLEEVVEDEKNGQGVGSVTNSPKRMWAICVGKASRPSKMWVASGGVEYLVRTKLSQMVIILT
jgi:hypothetical protein